MTLCPSCGNGIATNYCPNCGEPRPDRSHLRLGTFAHRAFEEITDLEHSKLLRTLRLLLFSPGKLTVEYLRGATKPYLGAIKLYLWIFGISLFLYSVYRPAAVFDLHSMIRMDRTGVWQQMVSSQAKNRHMAQEEFILEANTRWQKYVYFSEIIYPLVLAGALAILYFRSHRYYVEHLITSLHYISFTYLITILYWPIYAITGLRFSPIYFTVSSITIVISLVYLTIALRRVYQSSWVGSGWRAFALAAFYFFLTSLIALLTMLAALRTTARTG